MTAIHPTTTSMLIGKLQLQCMQFSKKQ